MIEGIIYMYTSPSNKVYIGQTIHPKQRIRNHRCSHLNDYFHNAIKKYGFDNFKYDVLHTAIDETVDGLKEKLDFWERFYISEYKSNDSRYGYNLTIGGEGVLGYVSKMKGKHLDDEVKEKISKSLKGKHSSTKTEWKKGNIPWNKDKKSVQSAWNKGKQWNEETRHKMSEASKGKSKMWLKGKPKTKFKYLTETGIVVEAHSHIVPRFHPNWILLES